MFTTSKVSKTIPDGSRQVLKNVNLCFFPGAKIGVVGLNGSGKTSLLRIMAGVDDKFDGEAVPMPGASIGYLPQEPVLDGRTVQENIDLGVTKSQALLDQFTALSVKCGEPLSDNEMARVMDDLAGGLITYSLYCLHQNHLAESGSDPQNPISLCPHTPNQSAALQDQIDAGDLWELDRMKQVESVLFAPRPSCWGLVLTTKTW